MLFQISTPQTIGALIAKQESKKASKCKSAHGPDVGLSTKRQRLLDASLPPNPPPPETHAMTITSPAGEPVKLVDASPSLADTQARCATDLGPSTEEQKSDHGSVDSSRAPDIESHRLNTQEPELDQGSLAPASAQVHNLADRVPAAKKQKLSYANLPPARKKLSSEEVARNDAYHCRRRLECWCRRFGFDDQIISQMSDDVLRSSTLNIYQFILKKSSPPRTDTYGALELDIYRTGCNPSVCYQTPIPSSSMNLPVQNPTRDSSDPIMGYSTTSTTSDKDVSVRSDFDKVDDTAASAAPNHLLPLSRGRFAREDTAIASSSQISAVEPIRNKGGRPKGRKPRPAKKPKTPKGPMRFQKNHPVKAGVDVYVWENILSFCPPDFLLKARAISSTFRSILRDDSALWKTSRVNHFGSDMPGPPLGLSERQYADLLTGIGCQTRGCDSQKARKTYWAFQKRLCIECFHKSFVPVTSNLISSILLMHSLTRI